MVSRLNRRLEGSYGLIGEGYFTIAPTFRDQSFHQLSTSGDIDVLADDFFDLIGGKFDRKTITVDQKMITFGLFFRG